MTQPQQLLPSRKGHINSWDPISSLQGVPCRKVSLYLDKTTSWINQLMYFYINHCLTNSFNELLLLLLLLNKETERKKKYQTQHIILRAVKLLVSDKLVLVPYKHELSMRNVTRSSQRFFNGTLLKAAISVRQKASLGRRCQRCKCYTEEPPFRGAAKALLKVSHG